MIYAENLTKEFKTRKAKPGLVGAMKALFRSELEIKKAVNNVSFHIAPGEIVGYIGANGAGKSTTIKMMTGILVPTSGKCVVNGIEPYNNRIQNAGSIGVVFGQRTQLWWDLPLTETYTILRDIYRVPKEEFESRMKFLDDLLGLEEFKSNTVRTLSLGQRMRADLAASMLHNPKILYLDEPSIGLDIVVKENIRKAIKKINKEYNTTVVLTTHDMTEIEELSDRIIIIDKGSKIYDGNKEHLKEKFGNMRTLEIEIKDEEAAKKIDLQKAFNMAPEDIKSYVQEQKLCVLYNKDKITTLPIISHVMENININDINIKDMPIEEIVKKIYRNEQVLEV